MTGNSSLPSTRMGLGLLQGGVLLALTEAFEHRVWPATDGLVFAPLLTVAIFIPILLVGGVGNLKLRTLLIWAGVAVVFCAGLAVYDIWRDPAVPGLAQAILPRSDVVTRTFPSATLWVSLAAMLFIMHSLIVSAATDGRWIASYPTHFDVSWKQGVQFFLVIVFVSVLWGLLFLGAALFRLIQIEFVAQLIRRQVFWIPVTAFAFSYAIHVTDVRANIVRGTRTLGLILLSWLLPVMTIIAVGFIAALLFTGLEPLWATRRAASILLIAAAMLIFLSNAAYQDGRAESRAAVPLRYAGVIAAIALLPLVALAGYAVLLRLRQYGWTPERITAIACVVVAACYGIGYVVAAARSRLDLRELETTNLVTSLIIVGILLLLRSPIVDPDRISVMDQVAALEAGRTPLGQFDFAFLRFRSGRFGLDALRRLAAVGAGPDADAVKERAADALLAKSPYNMKAAASASASITPQTRASNITVIQPRGAALPESFLAEDWKGYPNQWQLPRCLVAVAKCDALLVDLDDDGQPEILLLNLPTLPGGTVFKADADNVWKYVGLLANASCPGVLDALRAGEFETVQPKLKFKDIETAGQRLYLTGAGCAPVSKK